MLLLLPGGGEAMLDGVRCALEGFNDLPRPGEFILKLTNAALASIQTGGAVSKKKCPLANRHEGQDGRN